MIKPDIITVLKNEGIELKRKGNSFWSCCPLPLHSERTPSFKVDPERQTFHCFGCNEHGDVITAIMKLKGYGYMEALRYLGMTDGRPYKPDTRQIKKRGLVKGFRQWVNDYNDDLCTLCRTLQDEKAKAKTIEKVEELAEWYHAESEWLRRMDILESDDDKAKLELYMEVNKNENGF